MNMDNLIRSIDSAKGRIKGIIQRQKEFDKALGQQISCSQVNLKNNKKVYQQLSHSATRDQTARSCRMSKRKKKPVLTPFDPNQVCLISKKQTDSFVNKHKGQKKPNLSLIISQEIKIEKTAQKKRKKFEKEQQKYVENESEKKLQSFFTLAMKVNSKPDQNIYIEQHSLEQNVFQKKQSKQKQPISKATSSETSDSTRTTFMKFLVQQAALDKQLRQHKRSFELIEHSLGQAITQNELPIQLYSLKPTIEQKDPFLSTMACTPRQLIDSYQVAQQHWAGLDQRTCDQFIKEVSRQSELRLEALVTFVNLQCGTFFRNRDLLLIFRRLKLRLNN